MPVLTDSTVQVALAVEQKLNGAKAQLGIKEVYYGDQNKIPVTPAVCVEPGRKRRELVGQPRTTRMTIEVVILVYLMKVDSVQTTRRDVDAIGDVIEDYLHEDPQLGGIAIHTMVTSVESGYAYRGNTLFRTVRMIYEADSKVRLPLSQGGA